jgi:hypothetical protein
MMAIGTCGLKVNNLMEDLAISSTTSFLDSADVNSD